VTAAKLPKDIPDLGVASDAEIARRYGVSRERVRQVRAAAGLAAARPVLPLVDVERLQAALQASASLQEAAVSCGVPHYRARRVCRQRGLRPGLAGIPQAGTQLHAILAYLVDHGPQHGTGIALAVAATGPTGPRCLTSSLTQLARRGFIWRAERRRTAFRGRTDLTVSYWDVTEKGRAAVAAVRAARGDQPASCDPALASTDAAEE
jgi:hypothetical protein